MEAGLVISRVTNDVRDLRVFVDLRNARTSVAVDSVELIRGLRHDELRERSMAGRL